MLIVKCFKWCFGKRATGLVGSSSACREADAATWIDSRLELEITVNNFFFEIAGILGFFL